MAFRGYFSLNGVELSNSSRLMAHIGATMPLADLGMFDAAPDCALTPIEPGRLLFETTPEQAPIETGRLLLTPPDGSRKYSEALTVVGDCWTTDSLCFSCRDQVGYDDSWPGLPDLLDDTLYRPELAPWYSLRSPESAEFAGVWVMDVKGLDVAPVQREITEMAGAGGAAGSHRTPVREVTFDAMLLACTNAGLTYGLQWLTCQLLDTVDRRDSVLRYLNAHPGHSSADPERLVREVHGVVLTQEPQITDTVNASRNRNAQATAYRVSWKLSVTRPHAYGPLIPVDVDWDTIDLEPVKWVHSADCAEPTSCEPMPALFAEGCEVERIEVVGTPPPVCGGCLPVCAVETRVFQVPTFDFPFRCRETVANLAIQNTGKTPLTIQGYWRRCNVRDDCEDNRYPVQVSGLPSTATLYLDGISGRYWVHHAGRDWRPFGIVGTPNGAPWRPAVINRELCWEFVVVGAVNSSYDVSMTLADREV